MEGHLRGIIGQLTVEEIVKQPEMVGERMRSTCADDMTKMGLEVISFTIKEVRDKNDYITNMGRPDVARIKRDADVATAEAERDTATKELGGKPEITRFKGLGEMDAKELFETTMNPVRRKLLRIELTDAVEDTAPARNKRP